MMRGYIVRKFGVEIAVETNSGEVLDFLRENLVSDTLANEVIRRRRISILQDDEGVSIGLDGGECRLSFPWIWPSIIESLVMLIERERSEYFYVHASGVRINESVIMFVGGSTAGKTTLARALHARGYPLVSDDVVPIHRTRGGAATFVKNWKLREYSSVLARSEKWNSPQFDHSEEEYKVSTIFFLSHDDSDRQLVRRRDIASQITEWRALYNLVHSEESKLPADWAPVLLCRDHRSFSTTSIEAIDGARALLSLARHTRASEASTGKNLLSFSTLIAGAKTCILRPGPLEGTIRCVLETALSGEH